MAPAPFISIVVPNFNGGATLEKTLRSLVDQQNPDLEIIVIDGGSTDGSVEIIRRYASHLAHWESEKDNGQSHAINKGFAKARGQIVNWLCSDDLLLPGTVSFVIDYFAEHPDCDVLAGGCRFFYLKRGTQHLRQPVAGDMDLMPAVSIVGQPACFYRTSLLTQNPPVCEDLHYTMDLDLWCRFVQDGARWAFTDRVLAEAYEDGDNKTSVGGVKALREMQSLYRQYQPQWISLASIYVYVYAPLRRCAESGRQPWATFAKWIRKPITLILWPFYGLRQIRAFETWYSLLPQRSGGRPGAAT